jgi:hypothetical protein
MNLKLMLPPALRIACFPTLSRLGFPRFFAVARSAGFAFALITLSCSATLSFAANPASPSPDIAGRDVPPRLQLSTPIDQQISPFTGYTRRHWLEITERLLAGALPYFGTASGMPDLPAPASEPAYVAIAFPTKKQALERIMMLAVIYSGATGRDTIPGYNGSITAPFRKAMTQALDRSSPHFWGAPANAEHAGSIFALGALLSPKFFWEPFSEAQRGYLLDYLQLLGKSRSYDNNHYYFHAMTVPLLELHGRDSNRAHHTAMLERLFNWYRGDGWFIDGSNRSFDKYNAWGFHLYNLALFRFDATWRERFGPQIKQATTDYLRGYPYLFGRDGGPIPWGRSLSYRFAELAPLGWASLNGINPLPPGEARRIASGALRYFWEHGAQDKDGLLHVGYRGTNGVVAEFYSGLGTSYWAAQGLVALLIPENDPFWTDPELPMPADGGEHMKVIAGAEMVAHVRSDGEARLYPVGQPFSRAHDHWQRGVKYEQHAYSSALGWAALGEGTDLGAGRTGISLDGTTWSYRDHARVLSMKSDHVASAWSFDVNLTYKPAADDRSELITHTLIGRSGEVHVFWHQSPQPVFLHLGGYGIAAPTADAVAVNRSPTAIEIRTPEYHSVLRVLEAPVGAFSHEVLTPREGWAQAHLFGAVGTFPAWRSASVMPANTPVVIFVDGGHSRPLSTPDLRMESAPGKLTIHFDETSHMIPTPW